MKRKRKKRKRKKSKRKKRWKRRGKGRGRRKKEKKKKSKRKKKMKRKKRRKKKKRKKRRKKRRRKQRLGRTCCSYLQGGPKTETAVCSGTAMRTSNPISIHVLHLRSENIQIISPTCIAIFITFAHYFSRIL